MRETLAAVVDDFARLHVLVLGEAMLDSYLDGSAARLSREAPVPIVTLKERVDAPGGAANAAVNLRSLGAQVDFLSVTGSDQEGGTLRAALEARGVATHHLLADPGRQTLAKHRVAADSHLLLRFDRGTTDPLDPASESALIERLLTSYPGADAVLVSDYGYGVLTPRVIAALRHLQSRDPRLLVVDAKDPSLYREVGVTAVKPNYAEAARILGQPEAEGRLRLQQVSANADRLLELTGAGIAAVTLDRDGALILEASMPPYRTYARPTPHSRAAGAGDTFVSALTLALAAGVTTTDAAELASAASAVVVSKDGTAVCTALELRAAIIAEEKHVADREQLAARVGACREQGKRIVLTNGVFDILHRGHITYLNRAKALGDVLIVGVNSDASVRRLKGDQRPINSLEDRVEVLAALSSVDLLIAFEEDTPAELIRTVAPNLYVKGGDYSLETLPETALVEELGGMVQILPFVEDRSTTRLIQRVREGQETSRGRAPQTEHA